MRQPPWTFDDLAGDRSYRINEAIVTKLKAHYDREIRRVRNIEEAEVLMEELEELVEEVTDYFIDSLSYAYSLTS